MSTFDDITKQPIAKIPEGYLHNPKFKKDVGKLKELWPKEPCKGPVAHPVAPQLEKPLSDVPAIFTAREKIDAWHKAWNKEDTWCPLTPEELDALGDEAADDLTAYNKKLDGELPIGTIPDVVTKADFECYRCCQASKCPFVYDPYNTKGTDCLASK